MRRTDKWRPADRLHAATSQVERLDISAAGMDPVETFDFLSINFLPDLAKEAASSLAVSYRGLNLGFAALAINLDPRIYTILRRANFKPYPEFPKYCGEIALADTLMASEDLISLAGIVIVGGTNQDHGSGLEFPVIHPCEACRHMFACLPAIFPDNMPILSFNPENKNMSRLSPAVLNEVHGHPDMSKPPHYLEAIETFHLQQALQTGDFLALTGIPAGPVQL